MNQIKTLLNDFNVPVTIVNIAAENKYFAPETRAGSFALHDMLKGYAPSYYNSKSNNVVEGIMEFAKEYPSTLILLISHRHNFMEGLFYRSFTQKLSYISPFPLLVIRENNQ